MYRRERSKYSLALINYIDDIAHKYYWAFVFWKMDDLGADKKHILEIIFTKKFWTTGAMLNTLKIFNIWGFLFTELYYIYKGMYAKAFYLTILFIYINEYIEHLYFDYRYSVSMHCYWIFNSITCGFMANIDYYRLCKSKEYVWRWLPNIFKYKLVYVGLFWMVITSYTGVFITRTNL